MGMAIIENRVDEQSLRLSYEDGLYLARKAYLVAQQDDKILGQYVAEMSNAMFRQILSA